MDKNNSGNKKDSSMEKKPQHWVAHIINIFSNSKSTARFTLFIFTLFILASRILVSAISFLNPDKISIGDSTLSFSTKDDSVRTVLPSNVVWLDTQIDIESNSTISVKADGRIHLAIHYIVEAAKKDNVVKYEWSTPDGQGENREK